MQFNTQTINLQKALRAFGYTNLQIEQISGERPIWDTQSNIDDKFDDAEHSPVEKPYRHNACRECNTGTYSTTGRYDTQGGLEWDYEHVCDSCGHTIWKIV